MTLQEDRELKEKQDQIYQLGADWFTWKDDIPEAELGKMTSTTYRFGLGYQEHFDVTLHENGAVAHYSVTGSTKLFRNKQLPFQIARQMQRRSKELNRLLGP